MVEKWKRGRQGGGRKDKEEESGAVSKGRRQA